MSAEFGVSNLARCYNSGGSVVDRDIPCDPTAEVSACCPADGRVCANNLYCVGSTGNRYPGTCTNRNWGSDSDARCPCVRRDISGEVELVHDYRDGTTLCPDGGFCCGENNWECCNSGESSPIIDYGLYDILTPNLSSQDDVNDFYEQLAVSTLSISSALASGSGTGAATASAAAESTSDSTSDPVPTQASSGSSGMSTGAAVGVGIAATMGVILVVLGALFLVWRRKRQSTPGHAGHPLIPQQHFSTDMNKQEKPEHQVHEIGTQHHQPVELATR